MGVPPVLLLAAHGTASPTGSATMAALARAVAATRPTVDVQLCFLDVAQPDLPTALTALDGAVTVVPLLLSTGYHVSTDIPAAVAGRPGARVAAHLGPDPAVIEAVVDRLDESWAEADEIVLVAAGSSRPAARAEIDTAATALAQRLERPVTVETVAGGAVERLDARPGRVTVATYLLAEGRFLDALRAIDPARIRVSDPIGAHPAITALVWRRYDQAASRNRSGPS